MHKTLLIMAAGMASRYGGGKQIDGMGPNGEILMEYSIHDARKAGFDKVVFIIKRAMEASFRELLQHRLPDDIEVCYVCQEYDSLPGGFIPPEGRTKPYGTVHAVLAAKDVISEPFIVINADDFYGADAYATAAACLDRLAHEPARAGMVAYFLRNTVSANGHVTRGVCHTADDGSLCSVKETYKILPFADGTIRSIADSDEGVVLDPDCLVSMNFWCFPPSVFALAERELTAFLQIPENAAALTSEFTLPDLVDLLMHKGDLTVDVLHSKAVWFGVTYREDKPTVQQSLKALHAAGVYPEKL